MDMIDEIKKWKKEKNATKKARLSDELSNARENYKMFYNGGC